MAWTEPKIDWTITDAVSQVEFNNIGEDLAYLFDRHDRFVLSSAALQGVDLPINTFTAMQTVDVEIPTGKSLKLLHVRYRVNPTADTVLRVQVVTTDRSHTVLGTYSSTAYEGDDVLDETLYSNSTSESIHVLVLAGIYRAGTGPAISTVAGGWVCDLELV